jgi:N-acetyl-alpha-D-muramate 1-phosphate uridylyltransferase
MEINKKARAIIFSAGLGSRFKPWTDKHPKALAIVNGKPLLQRNIEYLQQYGITDVLVNVHHFAEQIKDAVIKNNGWGSNIIISDETNEVLETGGGLLNAKDLFKTDDFIISLNVDVLTDLNLEELIAFHKKNNPLITISISDRKTSRYFLFDKTNRLCGWRNTTTGEERISYTDNEMKGELFQKAYSCVVVYSPETFSKINFTGKFSLTDLYLELAKNQLILGYNHGSDKWVDVGKPESVAIAEELFT